MAKYIAQRAVLSLVTIFLIAFITFMLVNLIPGGPFNSEKAPSPAVQAAMDEKYGLDKPLLVQFKNYMVHLMQGDMGVSYKMERNAPVLDIVLRQFPTSAKIGGLALLIALVFGTIAGCVAAFYRSRWPDKTLMVFATFGVAVPSFVVVTISVAFFGVKLGWLPTFWQNNPQSYVLPCLALSLYPFSFVSRLIRSSMLDVINQDYIRTAYAKGLTEKVVVLKHALRNSIIPVISYMGPFTAYIITGGFVVETVYNIPGLAKYFIVSILGRDYPVVMGTTIFLASLVILMSLAVDILYRIVDPRIDPAKGGSAA